MLSHSVPASVFVILSCDAKLEPHHGHMTIPHTYTPTYVRTYRFGRRRNYFTHAHTLHTKYYASWPPCLLPCCITAGSKWRSKYNCTFLAGDYESRILLYCNVLNTSASRPTQTALGSPTSESEEDIYEFLENTCCKTRCKSTAMPSRTAILFLFILFRSGGKLFYQLLTEPFSVSFSRSGHWFS